MLLIPCPWCGSRDELEFTPRGEISTRPDPLASSDAEWVAYLYHGSNVRGWLREYWVHTHGCMQLLIVERHSVTHEVRRVHLAMNAQLGQLAT
jgi:sarcosine oxidase subunit delta